MTPGLVVHWLPRLGYGFIRPRGASPRDKDVYFHASAIEGEESTVYKYATVEFELNPHGGARPSATFVRVLKPATAQTTSAPAPTPKPVTKVRTIAARAPAPKPVAKELPPVLAKALGLIEEPEQRKTKRDRLSAHGR